MRKALATTLIVLLLLTSGCDYLNINSVAFALGIAIDETEEDMLQITLQFPLPGLMKGGGKGGGGGGKAEEQFFLAVGEGSTFPTALADVQHRMSRPISFGHLQSVLVSESLARKGLNQLLEQLWRFAEVDKLSYLLIVEGESAAGVLAVVPPQERLPALYLNTVMASVERTRVKAYPTTLVDALVQHQEYGRDLIVTMITTGPEKMILNHVAVFRDAHLEVTLTPVESLGLLIALGEAGNFPLALPANGHDHVVRRLAIRGQQIRVERGRDGRYRLHLSLKAQGEVGGIEGLGGTVSHAEVNILQEMASDEIRRLVVAVLERLQEHQVDPIGFFVRTYSTLHSDEHWREAFASAKLDIQVTTTLTLKGSID